MTNDAPAPFPSGGEVDLPETMQFRVGSATVTDNSRVPASLNTIVRIPETSASLIRDLALVEIDDDTPEQNPLIVLLSNARWSTPSPRRLNSALPRSGGLSIRPTTIIRSTSIWWTSKFSIAGPFDVDTYNDTGAVVFTGPPVPPEPGEAAWKDVVRCPPGEVTRIVMAFGDFGGRYVWHCHILEHEHNEMMRPFEVVGTRPIGRPHGQGQHGHIGIMLAIVTLPVYGQHQARIRIDAGWGNFSEDVTDANAWLAGFRAGYNLLNWLELEGQVLGGRASEDVGGGDRPHHTHYCFRQRCIHHHVSEGCSVWLVGFGGANLQVSPGISSFSDLGIAWQRRLLVLRRALVDAA